MKGEYKISELSEPIRQRILLLILFLAGASIIFIAGAGRISLVDPDESRYVSISKTMIEQSNYLEPYFAGKPYYDKPPMFFWLIVGVIKVFGSSELALRMVPITGTIITILATYLLAQELFDHIIGLVSIVVVTTMVAIIGFAKFIRMDIWLVSAIYLALWVFVRGYFGKNDNWYYLMYVFIAFGVLTKGLIAIVIPAGVIFIFMCWQRDWGLVFRLKLIAGLAIILAIAGPWFFYMSIKHRGYFHYFFIRQHFDRFTKQELKHTYSSLLYIGELLIGLLPWTVFTILAYIRYTKSAFSGKVPDSASRFLIIIPAFVILFFSMGKTKLINYILPAFPALGIITARFFYDYFRSEFPRRRRERTFALVYPTCFLLVVCVVGLWMGAGIGLPFVYHYFRWEGLQSGVNWWVWFGLFYKFLIAVIVGRVLWYYWRNWLITELAIVSTVAVIFLAIDLSYTVLPRIADAFSCKVLVSPILELTSEDAVIPFGPHKRWSLPIYLSGKRRCKYVKRFEELDEFVNTRSQMVWLITKDKWYRKLTSKLAERMQVIAKYRKARLILIKPVSLIRE